MIVFGQMLYGRVGRSTGDSYIATMFVHFWFVPLIPTRSYLIFEESEDGDGFKGEQIPLSFKSVIIGYLRGWLSVIAFLTTASTALVVSRDLSDKHSEAVSIAIFMAVFGILLSLVWCVLVKDTRQFLTAHFLFIALTAFWWIAVVSHRMELPDAAKDSNVQIWPACLISNASLIAYGLTRYFSPSRQATPVASNT